MLKVYTSTHADYHDSDRLDITSIQKTIFSPSWNLVNLYKSGIIGEDVYRESYIEEMRKSYRNNRSIWEEYLSRDRITLVCHCQPGEFCHRIIAAELLVKCGAIYIGEIDAS